LNYTPMNPVLGSIEKKIHADYIAASTASLISKLLKFVRFFINLFGSPSSASQYFKI